MPAAADDHYVATVSAMIERTMRAEGFYGEIEVTNVRLDRGIHRADVLATKGMTSRRYKAAIGGKRGIRITAIKETA